VDAAVNSQLSRAKLVCLLLLLGIAGLGASANWPAVRLWLAELLQTVGRYGDWAPPIYAVVYAAAALCLAPGSLLNMAGGFLFGFSRGLSWAYFGAMMGAALAFFIARYLARDWVARRINRQPRWRRLDETIAREGWRMVLLARLSPVLPYVFLNYAFGLSRISFRDYFLATLLGKAPTMVLYVWMGTQAGDLVQTGGLHPRPWLEWVFYAVGLAATVAILLKLRSLITRASMDT
jgi:uncharacterized membrane protein YdjX (TVP38/TMEM64 family)